MDCCGEGHTKRAESDYSEAATRTRAVARISLIGFALVAAFYLVAEHRAHLFGLLPYFILLACPLMHRFMHHGHREAPAERGAPSPAEVDLQAGHNP